MDMNEQEYLQYANSKGPKSPIIRDCFNAFWVGGLICVLGQGIIHFCKAQGLPEEKGAPIASMILVVLSVLLTGFSLYDNIAKVAGAGTLVPITGFANAIAAPAIEFKSEGFVLGVGAKMFSIAGPVIVYGTVASVIYGLIYWIVQML